MANPNTLDSWIDPERLEELLGLVRPGSLERPSAPIDVDADMANTVDTSPFEAPSSPPEDLLPEEIPERAFAKGVRPKLPPPEISAQAPAPPGSDADETPREEAAPAPAPAPESSTSSPPAAAAAQPRQTRDINPLNLYFHSVAPTPEARARVFVSWVRRTADASAAFVVDGYGAAIAAEPETDSVFLASLSNLADALGRGRDHFSRPDQSALHIEIEEGQILCLLQAKWDVATVALGMIRASPLPRDMAVRYRLELAKLIQKPRRRPRD